MDLASKVEDKVLEVCAKAEKVFNIKDFNLPKIEYSSRLVSTGGRAFLRHNKIVLNARMMFNNGDAFINEVVPHELCHIIEYVLYKSSHHNSRFYKIGEMLGYTLRRCHNFKRPVRIKPYDYNVAACGASVPASNSKIKHDYEEVSNALEKYEAIDMPKAKISNDQTAIVELRRKITALHETRKQMQKQYATILFNK